jgi:hypothetical protein
MTPLMAVSALIPGMVGGGGVAADSVPVPHYLLDAAPRQH